MPRIIGLACTVLILMAACSSEENTTPVPALNDPEATSGNVIPVAQPGSEMYTLGQQVYAQQCAACHGTNGEGQFPDAPLEPDDTGRIGAPPHDGTGHTWHHDDGLIVRYVIEGGLGDPNRFYPMPALGEVLTEDEIIAVIAYIKTMWSPEQQATQRERTLIAQQQ